MVSITIDRMDGLSSSTAMKGPCLVATVGNVTLSGLQTIDGIALGSEQRVLVRAQTDARANGIYITDSGPWRRAKDFSNNRDIRQGTQINVTSGDLYASSGWFVDTDDPIQVGVTAISIVQNVSTSLAGLLFRDVLPSGLLTLTEGAPLPTVDVVGATKIWYERLAGSLVPIFDGVRMVARPFTQLSLELDGNAAHAGYHAPDHVFDVFIVDVGGQLRLASGPRWVAGAIAGSEIERGQGALSTEIDMREGIWVNKNEILLRYGLGASDTITVAPNMATCVGSFVTDVTGLVTNSADRRRLANMYNTPTHALRRTDPTASFTYSSAVMYPVDGDPENHIEVLYCLGGSAAQVSASILVQNDSSTPKTVILTIGDSTASVYPESLYDSRAIINQQVTLKASYSGVPGLGRRRFYWLHQGAGSGAQTWYLNGAASVGMSGTAVN